MGLSIGFSPRRFIFFSIRNGRYSGASGRDFENAAWAEMTSVCDNLVGSISRNLKQNAEWQIELLDESQKAFIQNPLCRGDARLRSAQSLFDNFRFGRKVRNFSKNRLEPSS